MTAPWVDGEAITAAKMYTRVTVPFNNARTYPGSSTGTTDASGFGIITHGLGFIPSRVFPQNRGGIATTLAWFPIAVDSFTATTFRCRFMTITGSGNTLTLSLANGLPFNIDWLALA